MRVLASIIVPVYNVEKYLPRCMESLLGQTLNDIEIILVDDVSPDRCPQMCDEYARQDSRVKVIHKKVNEGLGMACNSGLDVATGEYVAFCDSDDWVELNTYESMYGWAKECGADAVFTGYKKVYDDGIAHGQSLPANNRFLKDKDAIHGLLLDIIASKPSERVERHTPMSAKTVLYRRELIERHHLRFESERKLISEDVVWNCDVLTKCSRVVIKSVAFYNYRDNPDSLTGKVRKDRFGLFVKLRDELLRRYAGCVDAEELRTRVDRMFMGYCRSYLRQIWNTRLLSKREKRELTKEIVCHPSWQEIRHSYPVSAMPLIHKLMFEAIVHKQTFTISLLCRMAEWL